MDFNTDLIIVGAGAAGLMAAATAAEVSLRCVVLERRHRPGLKLLMCGNNRCNISHSGTLEELLDAYGEPTASFLKTALSKVSPDALRTLFSRWGLLTIINRDRIYPASEDADDVLHCFTDIIRNSEIPFMTNCPVDSIATLPEGGFLVKSPKVTLTARYVLLATGGFSYPKTGSVGDGQRFAKELGLDVTDPRPGLAGVTIANPWLNPGEKADIQQVEITVFDGERRRVAVTRGNLLVESDCLRGTAVFDAVRQISRNNLKDFSLVLDLFPGTSIQNLKMKLGHGMLANALGKLDIPPALCGVFASTVPKDAPAEQYLKQIPLDVTEIRPLKEAIVTVGGVALHEIDSQTMECKRIPGLFFAGELMDIDGPTGGFNLHAAFATACLATCAIADKRGNGHYPRTIDIITQDRHLTQEELRRRKPFQGMPQKHTPRKRSDRGDRWDKPEPPSWNRRPKK
ncbi:MAG: aminoacetone oxidase family FAD-binding enzyme [Victivallales bacterium]|nr:aminoacetone oxidase family FAD-binding enzyme [Victivallales bacterium]